MRKLLRNCVPFFVSMVIIGLALIDVPLSTAATRYWRNNAGNGNWNDATKWSSVSAADTNPANNGIPLTGEPVNIVNTDGTARTVTLNTTAPASGQLGLLTVNLTNGGAATNTLSIQSANNLNAAAIFIGGHTGSAPTNGRGAISQSAGTVTVGTGGDMVLGHGAGSTGTYTLSGTGDLIANQSQYIGNSGTGIFNQSGGDNRINGSASGTLVLGVNAGSSGTYNLSGGNFDSLSPEYIGYGGTGTFIQTGGGHNSFTDLYVGNLATGVGTYTISAGVLHAHNNVIVGNAGSGTVNIQGTGIARFFGNLSINTASNVNVSGGTLELNTVSGTGTHDRINWTAGKISLDGDREILDDLTASQLFGFGRLSAGKHGEVQGVAGINGGLVTSTFEIHNGGVFSSTRGEIGTEPFEGGTVDVSGPGSAWLLTSPGYLIVGGADSLGAVLNVRNGGLVTGEINIVAAENGVVNLDGGIIRFYELNEFGGDGVFNFYSGTLQLAGNRNIGPDQTIQKILGGSPTLTSGKELYIEGTATVESIVTLDGGTFTAPTIVNGQNLILQRGRLNITNQAVTIGAGGFFGSTLDLNDDMTINVNQGITNQGLVTGDGQIGGTFTNAATGELRAEPGKSLKLTGGALATTNAGLISLYGGMLDISGNVFNNAGGFISGNGTLKTFTLNNSGTMNFSGLANIIGDVTNNSGGKIISSGGGPTTFHDDVTNNGEIRTSAGSFTTFFGSATGSGTYTGTGTVNFEGDLKPGSSPAAVNFAGDVVLGPAATLEIELGGTAPGTQHDKLNVAGELALDGGLEVSLINSFNPSAGQSFNILDWGSLAGTFSSLTLPTIAGLAWNTSQLYTTGVLSVAAAPGLAGDYNHDGTVNAADYVVWRKTDGGNSQGYTDWRESFGEGMGAGGSTRDASNAAVPEPPTAMMLIVAAVGICLSRRRIA